MGFYQTMVYSTYGTIVESIDVSQKKKKNYWWYSVLYSDNNNKSSVPKNFTITDLTYCAR